MKTEEKPVKNILKEYKEEIVCLEQELKFYKFFKEYIKNNNKNIYNEAVLYADYKHFYLK